MPTVTETLQPFEPVAVIGVSCRFPGASGLEEFAQLLRDGRDAVTEIPPERWTREAYLHADPRQPGKTYTMAAGIIDNVDRFDAAFFGISPREAEQMDPQQRLLLELAYEAFEDAGLPSTRLAGSRAGVYVGGSASDYLALRLGDPAVANAYFMTGATLSTLSNRISYVFDLKGPSFTVDTACSSSLVALHLACVAMARGEIDLAVVGGVNMLLSPQSFVGFSRASMLSPRGRCHAFAAGADGYVRSEGGGIVLLKPLKTALADGDSVRFVIEGTGVNSDGRTTGLSLPSRTAQGALLREVYDRAGIDPEDLVYVEAHGTGTAAGDPIEAGALGDVLGSRRSRKLPIGSVKTNIGHLEAGSGMAGLLKAMLVLRDGTIPASLHCEIPNPAIDFEALNLVLARESVPVQAAGSRPAAAAVNSFGFGGTNAHVVISAPPVRARLEPAASTTLPPLLLSARSDAALASLADAWRDTLADADQDAAALLRAAARQREAHAHRLAVMAPSTASMIAALGAKLAGETGPELVSGTAIPRGKIAFAYSGNGSQWAGMGLEGMHNPAFRAAMEEADAELSQLLGWSVIDKLETTDATLLRRTEIAQPLLFAVQIACTRALAAAGVTPAAHLGHSVGEVAAAAASGALSLQDAAYVIAARSSSQQRTEHQGCMAVLALPEPEAAALIEKVPGLEIAAVNSRSSVTVAGPSAALQRLERLAARQRAHFVLLDLDYAFHSAAMDPIRDGLLLDLVGIQPRRTMQPFYSAVLGRSDDGLALGPEYWWQNVRAPVRFAEALGKAIADGCNILMEIGPHPVLQSYLRDGLKAADAPGRVLSTLSRRNASEDPFPRLAAQAYVAGHDISAAAVFDGPAAEHALPHYPWQRTRFWYERTDEATDTIAARRDHPLLGFRRGDEPAVWFRTLDTTDEPWLADHAVDGAALLPATAMVEMALAAARMRHPEASSLDVLDLEITRPLLLERDAARELRFSVTGERGAFTLASRPRLAGAAWTVHATGRIAAGSTAAMPALRAPVPAESTLSGEALHALTTQLGLQYGPAFRTVAHVSVETSHTATVQLSPDTGAREAGYLLDPARTDGALQGLLALAANHLAAGAALLPWRIGRVRLARPDGAVIAQAQLRIHRVGPRSVMADIVLLDGEGIAVALFADCWFTRVETAVHDLLAASAVHCVAVPKYRPSAADGADCLPSHPAGSAAAEADEAGLLTEAFIASAAYTAITSTVGGEHTFSAAALVAEGRVHRQAEPLLAGLLSWLERDELARCESGVWTLFGGEDLPPAGEIWRSTLAEAPAAISEAALAGALAEALPAILRSGPAALPSGLAALTSHMLAASPTARVAGERLADQVQTIVASWPANRPIRLLELGSADASLATHLSAILQRFGVAVQYFAAVSPDADTAAIATALDALPGATVLEWGLGSEPPAGLQGIGFDLVVAAFALSRTDGAAETLAGLHGMMAPGGVLILAEPLPNRVWDLRFGADPAWWRNDGAGSRLQDASGWLRTLQLAGFGQGAATEIGGSIWNALLLTAQAQHAELRAELRAPSTGELLIVAAPGDPLAEALAEAMLGEGRNARLVPAGHPTPDRVPLDGDIVFIVPDSAVELDTIADAGTAVAAWVTALAETNGLHIWTVARDGLAAASLRGIARVAANEAPNVRQHFLQIPHGLVPDTAARLIAAELLSPDGEPEIDLTAHSRTVPRLRRGLGLPATSSTADARLVVGRPGMLDTLRWQRMDPAPPGPNQVAIAVAASGLNFRDVMWALNLLPDEALLGGLAGATMGLECAGTVTAVGRGVTHVQPGDRVMAIAPACLATSVLAPAQSVVRLPDRTSFAAGATVPVAFLTVCYGLGTLANLQPGERVLIHGGAGGVGLAAIQYAQHRGAEVFASAGSPAKRAVLRLLGVAHVLDSRSLAFADEVMAATDGEGVDVVLNSLAGEAMERSVGVLRPFGRFLELGKRDLYGNTPLGLRALRHNISYFAIDADQLPVQRPDLARRVFAEIETLMEQGVLKPLPYRPFGFTAATAAFRLMQSAGHIGKIVLEPTPSGLALPPIAPEWAPGGEGTYLVTGGLGGFGLEAARWLADRGVRSLALVARRGAATPGAEAALADLATHGVLARAFACDVADETALAATLGEIRRDMLPITGIVHAAMVLDDGLLPQLTRERFERVLRPKLQGALALDRLTRQDPIETFLMFSSITTTLGNPGQSNYVAANAAVEALARRRRAEGLPGMSIGWGPIEDVGYLAREKAVSDVLAQRVGNAHMRSADALALLPRLLASGHSHVDVGQVQWGALRQHLPHLATPMFAELMQGEVSEAGQVDIARLLAEGTPEEGRALVGQILAEEVAAITKGSTPQIDLSRSLTDLGMDSLMAVELRMALERRFGANLPLLSLADGASIESIAARIVRQIGAPAKEETALTVFLGKYEDDLEEEPAGETFSLDETAP